MEDLSTASNIKRKSNFQNRNRKLLTSNCSSLKIDTMLDHYSWVCAFTPKDGTDS